MRRLASRLAAPASPRVAGLHGVTPYEVVLKAVAHGGRGLLAAAEVFKEFQNFYRTCQQAEVPRGQATHAGATPSHASQKPLTQFCGRVEDVEPMTVLLLKVLCDLQKLEEMRFLFTQCLLELDDQPPSVELFNVFLLAISMTDTFNQYEVENLVELQRAKAVVPDVVTKLSMFLLYLRLGHHDCLTWWPSIRDEVEIVLEAEAVMRYPLLPLRLLHCFQTLLRVDCDTAVVQESFELLLRAAPERVTAALALPYILLSAMNASTPPSAVVDVLRAMEARGRRAAHVVFSSGEDGEGAAGPSPPPPAGAAAAAAAATSHPPTATGVEAAAPVLSSEITVLRLLAKCAKYGDADAAAYLRAYIDKYRHFDLLSRENSPVAALLYVEALTKAGRVRSALRVLETEVPAPYNQPGERPKLFLPSRRLSLLSTDPVRNVVAALVPLVDAVDVEDPALSLVAEKLAAEEAEEREPVPVSATTLDLLVAACQFGGGASRAEEVLLLYPRYEAKPTCTTYTLLLEVYATTAPEAGVQRLWSLEREMSDAAVAMDAAWLRVAMDVALNARDIGTALRVAALNVAHRSPVDVKHGSRLLREMAVAADAAAMRRALHLLRSSNCSVDPRSVALCTAVLRSRGIPASALRMDESANTP
ncbi:hypothetical protein NESM_000474900 [Novymonas esmeraldas]|uniref:Uncharacterized protein n=1 Tax=Novymonas esmeraldas TaxID=1808958 RepID=A0AAW0EMW6_9TRYP